MGRNRHTAHKKWTIIFNKWFYAEVVKIIVINRIS